MSNTIQMLSLFVQKHGVKSFNGYTENSMFHLYFGHLNDSLCQVKRCVVMNFNVYVTHSVSSAVGVLQLWNSGCMKSPRVPTTHTKMKIHRNRRSITMATYFQSSMIWNKINNFRLLQVVKTDQSITIKFARIGTDLQGNAKF